MSEQSEGIDTLRRLEKIIAARMEEFEAGRLSAEDSRVAKALSGPPEELLRKLPEEAVEVILAFSHQGREELAGEAADLLFHLLLILHARQVPLAEVLAKLAQRLPSGDE